MSDEVLTEQRDRVLVITLNRPDQMNAVNQALAGQLLAAVDRLDADPGLTAGVLTGNGKGFSAGMDLKAFARGEDMSDLVRFVSGGSQKPLIGAVEGFALAGGLELALACDLLVASSAARFGIPEVKRGLFAAGGGVFRLPSRVGYGKAMEMAVTGDPISADEALGFGLIARSVEPGTAVEAAIELAERIAENAPLAVAASKQIVRASVGATDEEMWAFQASLRDRVFSSNDAVEGPAAFAEKRDPHWTGT